MSRNIPFECVTLLLQGGGALGAYQGGVYQALSERGLEPDWVAGMSIGAINAAIIAGNPPEARVDKLRRFWEMVTEDDFRYFPSYLKHMVTDNDSEHQMHNYVSAVRSLMQGIPGFFRPRPISPWFAPHGELSAVSFYDTKYLQATLEKLVDFDRINRDAVRLNVAAVNVRSGNYMDFDNQTTKITPAHIMASGALPPGFPPVEIDGQYYWDGGLISNTPLQWVVENKSHQDMLVFQVDLWSASGEFPENMADVLTRHKDIQYSSRTRANTDRFKDRHCTGHSIAHLLKKLPEEILKLPEMQLLSQYADEKVYNIVHLIYHNKPYEGYSKDFEFSRMSMEAHWGAGYKDTMRALDNPEVLQRPTSKDGIAIFDLSEEELMKKRRISAGKKAA